MNEKMRNEKWDIGKVEKWESETWDIGNLK
jgi:hypothetical protein